MSMHLKVLSLNCWAIPISFVTKLKDSRIYNIGLVLSNGDYDVVLLQEIWSQRDYNLLLEKVEGVMPYSHYWHSGLFGSGLCIFSKFQILDTFQYNFSLNGYAERFYHGDWYGGKCVGLAKIAAEDFNINVYNTHTHATYRMDQYESHRIVQAYELSQFIRFTSEACDVCIVGGDFNFKPTELGYFIIKSNANLEDAWITQTGNKGHESTCNSKDNSFSNKEEEEICIDYIMYRSNSGNIVDCESCCVSMSKVPGESYNFSDHEGVVASLVLRRHVTAMATPRNSAELEKQFTEATPVLNCGIKTVKARQVYHLVTFLLSVVLLIYTADLTLYEGLDCLLKVLRTCLTVVAIFSVWSSTVMAMKEINALTSAKKDINNLLKANPAYCSKS